MKTKTLWLILAAITLTFASCNKNDGDDPNTPEQTTRKYSYKLTVRQVYSNDNVNAYHTNLYPLYQEFVTIKDNAEKQHSAIYTVEVSPDAKESFGVCEEADNKALPEMKARLQKAIDDINNKTAGIKAKMKSLTPTEYEQYTARVNAAICVEIIRNPDEIFTSTVQSETLDPTISFNADAYKMNEYFIYVEHKNSTPLDNEKTPKAVKALSAAFTSAKKELENRLAATGEGSRSTTEQIVMKTAQTPLAHIDSIAMKIFAQRIKATEQWTASGKEIFMKNFDPASIPQAELDQLDYTMTVNTMFVTPFQVCSGCNNLFLYKSQKHAGCDYETVDFTPWHPAIGEPFVIDALKKK